MGIQLDDESWYSVTPESFGEYMANRVVETFPNQEVNVLDAFAGCGGNIIQFAKAWNKVYGCEIDPIKIGYCDNNCKIYEVSNYKVWLKDYLTSTAEDFESKHINAVFLSPPWGGVKYIKMPEYKFEYMTPNYNDILSKSLEFSKNLILFIPRNTDVKEICSVLSIYSDKMCEMGRENEVVFEIERLGHQYVATSVLVVYTGDLARVSKTEICDHICQEYLNLPKSEEESISLMIDIMTFLESYGCAYFTNDVFLRKGQTRISAESVVSKKIKALSAGEKRGFDQTKKALFGETAGHEETKVEGKKWWVKSNC